MCKIWLFVALVVGLVACRAVAQSIEMPTPAPPSVPVPEAYVFAEGLLNPVGMAMINGRLLIAEEGSGEGDNSAGITLVMPDGRQGRLLSGLPSGRDSGDLSGVPFVAVAPEGERLYTSHFNLGHLLTWPIGEDGLQLPDTPLTAAVWQPMMLPLHNVQLINPFDMTFDVTGRPVVSDASNNGVAIMNDDGTTRFFHRFDLLANPAEGKRLIDAVPTGITRVGDEYLVTLTGGCPYPTENGRLVAIDAERNQRTIATNLNMPIDITQDSVGNWWLLEFAQFAEDGACFSGEGYLPHTGRLSKVSPSGEVTPILTELNLPTGITFDEADNIFISELANGRVLQVQHLQEVRDPLSVLTLLAETAVVEVPAVVAPSFIFEDVAAARGLTFTHGAFATSLSEDPIAMMGGGLCWLDYDNDGWLDLYLVNSHALAEVNGWLAEGGLPTNGLFHNENGRFVDVSEVSQTDMAMRGNGCVAADFDLDGWVDIYVTAAGPNALLWNQGDGTFVEGAMAAGVAATAWNTAVSVGDVNGDGWPDLFVAAYIDLEKKIPKPSGAFPQDYYGLPDHLYLNGGDGTFDDVAAAVGLVREERGLGSIFTDLDRDGDLDLYIANDGHPNRLYMNSVAENTFGFALVDVTRDAGVGDSGSGMGVTSGDYDGDGRFDLFVTNWEAEVNALYRNESEPDSALAFRYNTYRIGISGLGNGMTGWGTRWADFDHDGDSDLLVVNGRVPITDLATDPELVRFYGNRLVEVGPNSFREWTQRVGLGRDGVGPLLARGSAVADYDNDGDLDVAINIIGGAPVLLEASGVSGNWLMLAFDTAVAGIRAEILLPDGSLLVREGHIGSSYLASEDPRLHVGVGNVTEIEQIRLFVANRDVPIVLENVPVNQILTVSTR